MNFYRSTLCALQKYDVSPIPSPRSPFVKSLYSQHRDHIAQERNGYEIRDYFSRFRISSY